jgi:hypothetical protein
MPIRITYDRERQGVESYYIGTVTTDERLEAYYSVATGDQFSALKYWIIDTTSCDDIKLNSINVDSQIDMIKTNTHMYPNIITALVAPNDLIFGMSRMFQMKAESVGIETMVFGDRASADEWVADELQKRWPQ